MYIVNGNTGAVTEATEPGIYSLSLTKGTYYFCISGSMSSPNALYRFSVINNKDLTVSKVEISNIAGPNCAKVDYGYGNFWRIQDSMDLKGKAYNSKGELVPNAPVIVRIAYDFNTGFTNWSKLAVGETDSEGNFEVTINNIPHAYSEYSAVVGTTVQFIHYFDIIPISFYDGTNYTQANCDDQWLYHFAVSEYLGGL